MKIKCRWCDDKETYILNFSEGNRISYGQDFSFFRGVPSEVDFQYIDCLNGRVNVRSYGYGILSDDKYQGDGKSYGNGCLFISEKEFPAGVLKKLKKMPGKKFYKTVGGRKCSV